MITPGTVDRFLLPLASETPFLRRGPIAFFCLYVRYFHILPINISLSHSYISLNMFLLLLSKCPECYTEMLLESRTGLKVEGRDARSQSQCSKSKIKVMRPHQYWFCQGLTSKDVHSRKERRKKKKKAQWKENKQQDLHFYMSNCVVTVEQSILSK